MNKTMNFKELEQDKYDTYWVFAEYGVFERETNNFFLEHDTLKDMNS